LAGETGAAHLAALGGLALCVTKCSASAVCACENQLKKNMYKHTLVLRT
jgi:hypothetical protein